MIKLILAFLVGSIVGAKFPEKVNLLVASALSLGSKLVAWVKQKFQKK